MRFILGAKPDDHEHLFGEVAQAEAAGRATTLRWTDDSTLKRFSWVTDLTITPNNARHLVRGGRSRWKIENETFNTLKNQGYQFGHNFGYGTQNLSTNFAMLMMLAFLVDQTQELCCSLFQAVRQKRITRRSLWDHQRSHFRHFEFTSMQQLHEVMLYDLAKELPASRLASHSLARVCRRTRRDHRARSRAKQLSRQRLVRRPAIRVRRSRSTSIAAGRRVVWRPSF
jgi:hypothetical protein